MFDLSDVIADTVKDDIQPLLQKLQSRKGWNAQAKKDLDNLVAKLRQKKLHHLCWASKQISPIPYWGLVFI